MEKIYYALVNFFAKNEGWLTIKANSEDEARDILMKEFASNDAITGFNITEVKDVPPIMPSADIPADNDDDDEDEKEETVH